MENRIEQKAGNSSTNLQVVNFGISYTDAQEIALNVFKDNFLKLSKEAENTAVKRIEELVNDFLNNLYETNKELINKLQEPAVQYSLYNVQREYAKTGDKELKVQSLYLLVERLNSEERSLTQIVLDEAIEILPKLSKKQLNLISLLLITQPLFHYGCPPLDKLKKLCSCLPNSVYHLHSTFDYLQSLGCLLSVEVETYNSYSFKQIEKVLKIYSMENDFSLVENIENFLYENQPELFRLYSFWKLNENKKIKFTPVGFAIALANWNIQTDVYYPIEQFFRLYYL